jgi:hypothetical protein
VFGGAALIFAGAIIGTVAVPAGTQMGVRLLSGTVSALLCVLAWRFLRVSLVLDQQCLRTKNFLHSYCVPWSEVVSVDLGEYPFSAAVVRTTAGSTVPVSGLLTYLAGPTYRYWTKRRNIEIVQAINRNWYSARIRP